MSLCRKHQEIQKIALSRQTEEAKIPSAGEVYSCVVCKEAITADENSYSVTNFNMALCRKHQEVQKQIRAKAETDQKTNEKHVTEVKTSLKIDTEVPESLTEKESIESAKDSLVQWLIQWASARPINQPLTAKHFFIEGMRLEELAIDAIAKAQDEILVTTPYRDNCFLVSALQEARNRRANVKIITRRPNSKDDKEYSKLECQGFLRKNGVSIHYDNTIHSKIIVIDHTIAVVSSMNIYSGSTGGGSLEAGIVTFEEKVVESVAKYVATLLEKPESPDLASVKTANWRNTRHF
jgi:phosphatidylserine/phosphatidylglycerophosphate/cardiolipin synthase-like enzyme